MLYDFDSIAQFSCKKNKQGVSKCFAGSLFSVYMLRLSLTSDISKMEKKGAKT